MENFIKIGNDYFNSWMRITLTPPGASDNPKAKVKQGSITLRFSGDDESQRVPLTPEQYTAAVAWLAARSEDVLATPMPAAASSQAELAS